MNPIKFEHIFLSKKQKKITLSCKQYNKYNSELFIDNYLDKTFLDGVCHVDTIEKVNHMIEKIEKNTLDMKNT